MSWQWNDGKSEWLTKKEDELLEEMELFTAGEFYDFDTKEAAREKLEQFGRDYTRYILENVIPCKKLKTTYTVTHKDMDELLRKLKEGETTNG